MTAKSPRVEVRRILNESGILTPDQLDLDVIARANNLKIRYANLDGCAANILGLGNRGVITIDKSSTLGRKRFSIAHEIGHWVYDRHRGVNMCKDIDMGSSWSGKSRYNPIERRANVFAAELLLPKDWFISAVSGKPTTFETVADLQVLFKTSLSAAALRLVELGEAPSLLLYFDNKRVLKRFKASSDIDGVLFPHKLLSESTTIWSRLFNDGKSSVASEQVDGDSWINHPRAFDLVVSESAIRVRDEILVLVQILNESVLLDILADVEKNRYS